jgi:2-deoxy-D-gluconate 3-dehydrogenase
MWWIIVVRQWRTAVRLAVSATRREEDAMFRVDGKVALITGAATGIGQAIALALAQNGADVAISDKAVDALAETEALIQPTGRRIYKTAIDVCDPVQVQNGLQAPEVALSRIDILINNAGINRPALGLDVRLEEWDDHFNTNVRGGFSPRRLPQGE